MRVSKPIKLKYCDVKLRFRRKNIKNISKMLKTNRRLVKAECLKVCSEKRGLIA